MPTHRVTIATAEAIARHARAGTSARKITEALKTELGISLTRRTVDRYVAKLGLKGAPSAPTAPPPPRFEAPPPRDHEPTLDGVLALEREATELQRILAGDLPPRDRVALVGELRKVFGAIQRAQQTQRAADVAKDHDVQWVVAKLQRFAEMNAPAEPASEDDDELPEAAGTAHG
jgi:hypothetical protein